MESIEAVDERTLVLGMSHPYYEVLNVVKTGFWAIANIETRNELAEQYGQSGVDGTGPFLFQEWVPGSHTSVTRWEDYPGSIVPYFTNKGKAYLDGIRWETILEAAQRAVRIENAEIDTLRNPALQDVARLQKNPDLSVSNFSEPSGYILSTNFERTDLDFHELTMRQAISHAIDRQAIVTALLSDLGSPLYGPITPADVFYDPGRRGVQSVRPGSGQVDGRRAGLDARRRRHPHQEWRSPRLQPGRPGRVVQPRPGVGAPGIPGRARHGGHGRGARSRLVLRQDCGGRRQLVSSTTCGRCRSTSSFSLSARRTIPAAELEPRQAFRPSTMPSRPGKKAANAEELKAAGDQFQLVIAEQLPTIPLVVRNSVWVSRPNVHGWLPHQYDIYPHYNDVWLDPA